MKNKRAAHVGMILSFVIFILFILFMYIIVQPAVNTGEDKKILLETLKAELIENVSENLTSASVNINQGKNPSDKDCVEFENLMEKLEVDETIDSRLVVKDAAGNVLAFYSGDNDLEITRESETDTFFKIYNSPKFNVGEWETTPGCKKIKADEYTIGLITNEKYIFLKSIEQLATAYNTDEEHYEQVKEQLNVPSGKEFGFNFINNLDEKIFDVGNKVVFTNVFSEEIPIQYISNDDKADILSGFINIRIW